MYFKQFPTIPYDAEGNGKFKDVKNLLRRVGIRAKVKANTSLYDTYDVKNGETPESLAHKLYDDSELHWVILLLNNVTDRFHDWPMSEAQFIQFVNDKYDDPNGTHHYEITQASGDTTTKINIGQDNSVHASATVVTNYEHEEAEQDKKRQIKILQRNQIGKFVSQFNLLMGK